MITKKNLLYNFIFRASSDKKIRTYYHPLEPLFHSMSDNNMFLNFIYVLIKVTGVVTFFSLTLSICIFGLNNNE